MHVFNWLVIVIIYKRTTNNQKFVDNYRQSQIC